MSPVAIPELEGVEMKERTPGILPFVSSGVSGFVPSPQL
jgi:hypothetical protein